MAKLQAKQYCEPTPQPFSSNQAMLLPITPLPVIPLEPMLVRKSKKIVVVPDPLIFNKDKKEKEVSYDHWLLQMRNKITANEKMISMEILKKAYVQNQVSCNALTQLEP